VRSTKQPYIPTAMPASPIIVAALMKLLFFAQNMIPVDRMQGIDNQKDPTLGCSNEVRVSTSKNSCIEVILKYKNEDIDPVRE